MRALDPVAILFDLQGPKLRVGGFADGSAMLETGQTFVLDRDTAKGDSTRAELPHPELFETLKAGDRLLIDDGKVRLTATSVSADRIEAEVTVGGKVSDNKGVNVPDVVVPIPALTDKDRSDLAFALYGLGSYDEAADIMTLAPDAGPFHILWLAAAQAMAGRLDAAAGSFDKLMRRLKPADLDQYCRDWTEFEYEADFAHFQQGVRIAEQAFRDRSQSDGEPVNSTAGS